MLPKIKKPKRKNIAHAIAKIAIAQQPQFNHRIAAPPLPPNREHQRDTRDHEESRNQVAAEPVILLAAIQYYFEASETQGDQRDADIVNTQFARTARSLYFLSERRGSLTSGSTAASR